MGQPEPPGARAARFVEEVLLPLEVPAEIAGGPLPAADAAEVTRAALDARVHGGLHAASTAGTAGASPTGSPWRSSSAAPPTDCPGTCRTPTTSGRRARRSRPSAGCGLALRGELHDAYAVTEAGAGSDPSAIATVARRTAPGRWVLDGEKWFVTFGSVAAVIVVMARTANERAPTLFAVPADSPGVEIVADPPFTHAFPHGHPTMRFTGVELTDADLLGAVGAGEDLQRRWFVEERLAIAARCVGAMQRLLVEAVCFAAGRDQGGARLIEHQGVSFPLADSASDAAAGRLLGLEVARLMDAGADPKVVHGKVSMAKLFCSEAAGRCADRVVQVFGGRGYMRTTAAERMWRELRVDRIWEGTSEIQRLIVARSLERRGVPPMLT